MKFYGIEICRFCGVDVSTSTPTPSILPEFIVNIPQKMQNIIVAVDTLDVVDFNCVIKKPTANVLKAVYEEYDTEDFTVMIPKVVSNKLIGIMADYEVN